MSLSQIRHRGRLLVLAALALLAGLALSPAAIPAPTAGAADSDTVRLRAAHAVPDFGPVDVYVNGARVLGDVPFFTVSPYLEVPAGDVRVQVIPAGESLASPSLFVINRTFTVSAPFDYTVVARGSVAGGNVNNNLFHDENDAPPFGQARVRVAHLSPDAPAVDIFVNGERVIEGLSYVRTSPYLSVPPGTYEVGVAPAGGSPIYTTSLSLEAGTVYTAWANGLLAGAGAQAFKVTPTVDKAFEAARVRAVHAVPDVAGSPVDVYLNGAKAVTFDFFEVTDYLPVYAGDYDVRVVLEGGDPATEAVIQADVSVMAGIDYSIVASGTGGAFGATVLEDDNGAPEVGQARLRAAHFSPDAPAVDIFVDGARAIEGLSFREATGYLGVPAGTYEVGIAPAGGSPIYSASVTLEAGVVYTAWANGLLGGSGAQAFKVTPSADASFELARLRLLHAAPDAPAVDVYLDGARVAGGLSFGELGGYLPVYAGSYGVQIAPAGSRDPVLSATVTLEPGKAYTAAATGLLGGGPAAQALAAGGLGLALFDDSAVPATGKGSLRVVHLAPDAPAVDVLSGEAAIARGLSFGESASAELEPALVGYRVTPAGGDATLLSGQARILAGSATTVYVLGLAGEAPAGQGLRLLAAADAPGGVPSAAVTVFLPVVHR